MIEKISPGSVVIEGKTYTSDILILPSSIMEANEGEFKPIDRIICPWQRKEELLVALSDLNDLIPLWPDALVIGVGFSEELKVASDVKVVLSGKNIHVMVFSTEQACEAYNEMAQGSRTAFAIHLK